MQSEQIQLAKSTHWKGVHRGVPFHVVKWAFESEPENPKWNSYITLSLDQFKSPELASQFWPEDEQYINSTSWHTPSGGVPMIHDMDFHGGVTFFQKHVYPGAKRAVEIGCDYSHIWDSGRNHTEQKVAHDIIRTIDLFMDQDVYLCRCSGDGTFHPESEGEHRGGYFYSNAWTAKRAAL